MTRVRIGVLVAVVLGALGAPSVAIADHDSAPRRGTLRNFVIDLFPGGIRLQPGVGHDPHFIASSLSQLTALDQNIGANLNQVSPTSGVAQFTFDVERGMPVESEDSLGPLTGQRATTLGAHKLTLGVSFTRIEYKRFEGRSLHDINIRFTHEDSNHDACLGCAPNFFEKDTIPTAIKIDLSQEIFAVQANYGLTDRWDAGFVIPVVTVRARATAVATIERNSGAVSLVAHNFGPNSVPPSSDRNRATAESGGQATGLGDILLRTKYTFLKSAPESPVVPDLAGFLQMKLPSGNRDRLLGTGETDVLAMVAASHRYGLVTPYANLGYEMTTAGRRSDNIRYLVGADVRVTRRLTLAAEVLGRLEPIGDGVGDHLVDFAMGGKINLFRAALLNFAVEVPLNKNRGLRPDAIWTVGLEYAF